MEVNTPISKVDIGQKHSTTHLQFTEMYSAVFLIFIL